MQARLVLAESYLAAGQFEEAARICRDLLAAGHDTVPVRLLAGLAAHRAEQPEEVLGHAERLTALDPSQAAGWLLLGGTLRALGRTDEAEAAYRLGCANAPADPRPPLGLANLLLAQARHGEAADYAETAAVRGGADPDLLAIIAAIMLKLGLSEKSRRLAERALALQPDHPVAAQMREIASSASVFDIDALMTRQTNALKLFMFD
ncbi:MAG: tetratricopeptide repeat protein [Caulobacter sp.]|nr:tetratricopeptide repeat protein [Caulobacter sp.]